MKRYIAYAFSLAALLLTFLSCAREEMKETEPGGIVTIRFATASMQDTKAQTPGSGGAGDGGSFSDYSMHFDVPAECTLSVWASDDASDYSVGVLAGGVTTNISVNSSSSKQIDFTHIPEGRVTVYPAGGAMKFYKISYTHAGGTKTWDFNDADFKALLSPINPLQPHPALDGSGIWNVTLDGLTIWSKGSSTWSSAGYFQWAGGYTDIEDLIILIANSAGNIVITYPDSGRDGIPYGTLESHTAVEATLKFSFSTLAAGDYTVYAFGNTGGLWPMTDGTNNYASGSDLLSLTTEEQVNNLRFQDQERNTIGWENDSFNDPGVKTWDDGLVVLNGRIPVSAKASLKVSAGKNGEAYLELVRCVAKVTAIIKNNTSTALDLLHYRHTVHDINPSSGYVIPRESNDFCGTAGNLLQYPDKKYDPSTPTIHISEVGSEEYSWYVFPSKGPYNICIGFTENSIDHTYFNLPITNWRQANIPELKRNQHLIVTTRLSVGKTVSFNFTVNEWDDDHVSTVSFD